MPFYFGGIFYILLFCTKSEKNRGGLRNVRTITVAINLLLDIELVKQHAKTISYHART